MSQSLAYIVTAVSDFSRLFPSQEKIILMLGEVISQGSQVHIQNRCGLRSPRVRQTGTRSTLEFHCFSDWNYMDIVKAYTEVASTILYICKMVYMFSTSFCILRKRKKKEVFKLQDLIFKPPNIWLGILISFRHLRFPMIIYLTKIGMF